MRIGSLVALSPIIIASIGLNGPIYFFKYFTQWGILAIIISTFLIRYASRLERSFNE